ncbi:hypothetical protein GCM10010435_20800 [Winogradskya consettensis]|uniref:Uncharacterized protein n=1 Tax=Winogradskya consettensis TaxID=113560 RepID=A0A919SVY1_9ACTN|nr:hypothetical protein Aco04nite_58250 [Actinoplanes consettensis]
MESAVLRGVRETAASRGVPLDEFLRQAVWHWAIAESAKLMADYERQHPDDMRDWREHLMDQMFAKETA